MSMRTLLQQIYRHPLVTDSTSLLPIKKSCSHYSQQSITETLAMDFGKQITEVTEKATHLFESLGISHNVLVTGRIFITGAKVCNENCLLLLLCHMNLL
jgi:hypothetical protein